MAEQRTIILNLDAVTKTDIAAITGSGKLNAAIGYLASWNMTFGHVTIIGGVHNGVPEILATYRADADAPSVGYTIGAVWHGDHFGFHS